MTLDKELLRQVHRQYRQWNEDQLVARARRAGRLSPAEGWRQYVALWQLCLELAPPQSRRQRQQRLEEWGRYYDRIRRLETWRRRRAR